MFDPTKPVQTRDGRKARIICTDLNSPDGCIVALVESSDRYNPTDERVKVYYSDGKWVRNSHTSMLVDLVNISMKTSTWQNVYDTCTGAQHPTRNNALAMAKTRLETDKYLGMIRRDYEDGKFVHAEFEPVNKD